MVSFSAPSSLCAAFDSSATASKCHVAIFAGFCAINKTENEQQLKYLAYELEPLPRGNLVTVDDGDDDDDDYEDEKAPCANETTERHNTIANKLTKIDVTNTHTAALGCTQDARLAIVFIFHSIYMLVRTAHVLISCLSTANSHRTPTQDNGIAASERLCVSVCAVCVSVESGMLTMTARHTSFSSIRRAAPHSAQRFSHFNEASCATTYSPLETKTNGGAPCTHTTISFVAHTSTV